MHPLAFVFPGQGSQQIGMGWELHTRDRQYRRLVDEASRLSGIDVSDALPSSEVSGRSSPAPSASTVRTQLSIFALSVSLGRHLLQRGLRPQLVAGHSLGELSALVVGQWLDVEVGLALVWERAVAMERCCEQHAGAMAAVMGLDGEALSAAVQGTGAVVANSNSPKQSVVSGDPSAVAVAAERAQAAGATTVIELPVAGAFHSPLMAAAAETLRDRVQRLPLTRGTIPLISSITGTFVDDIDTYRRDMAVQITAPVRWWDVMKVITRLATADAREVVEVGPGAVLRGLFRHVDRHWPVSSCSSLDECSSLLGSPSAEPHSLPG